ncbi:hypothetical protein ACQ9LF_08910 [Anaerohalosphaeraceae bacterium U12dextr]
MKTNAEQMKDAYQNAKLDIASLLDRIGQELEKNPERLNWGHVGDLTGLRQNLIEALSGMTGMAEHAIRETLEDIRTDAQNQK